MKIERLALRAFSPAFPDVVDVPFRELEPGVYAVVGQNGAGKTTLMEASGPGALYRQMPSSDGDDPVLYATTRDASIVLEFAFAFGRFRSTLSLDGPKRQSDALLEQLHADGSTAPLNDGKRTTYDAAIRERFPSYDLFLNSSFTAQGRGAEFTNSRPAQKKDLFSEFLGLGALIARGKTAHDAAELAGDARLRLEVQVETLTRDTAPAIATELDKVADQLQRTGGDADVRQRTLKSTIATLEARAATMADRVSAYAAATERVTTLKAQLAGREMERGTVTRQVASARSNAADERARIVKARDAELPGLDERIANNEAIRTQATEIRAAVVAIQTIDGQLLDARALLTDDQAAMARASSDRRAVEKALSALAPVETQLTRAKTDAALLESVPCHGDGEYAACQLLVNAQAAKARIAQLETEVLPKATLADRVGVLTRTVDTVEQTIALTQTRIRTLEADRARHAKQASYESTLAAADARLTELAEKRATLVARTDEQLEALQARTADRLADLDDQGARLDDLIDRLRADVAGAESDLTGAAEGNHQAAALKAELDRARLEWDTVTATIAKVTSGREELERRRRELEAKRLRLVEVRDRLARVEAELVEWKDLAKALSKGGLPDLEIDAAGPTITATTNAILQACFGSRYSLELVTQVAKADGSGMKDEFTVRVLDNEAGGDWRDIKAFSGGQRTILQEALMCAICCYVNERSPMPIRTLWRDETGAALDPENAVRYVAMLRRVRELGGLVHVFFVSHNSEAAALADAQIHVGNGRAEIVRPPYAEVAA